MATPALEDQQLSLSQLLDLPTLEYWQPRVEELILHPERTIIQGVERKTLLLRLEDFVYHKLSQTDVFPFDASFIYREDPRAFLDKILSFFRSIRPRLIKEASQVRGLGDIVKEYERYKENELVRRKKEALVLEHLKTTEALTRRLTAHIAQTKAGLAKTVLDHQELMNTISPLAPGQDEKYFLAEHIAENIQNALSDITLSTDIKPGHIKAALVKALSESPQGQQLASLLDTNPQIIDNLYHTIMQKNAEDIAKAARYGRSIGQIFESVGGSRLEAFVRETSGHFSEELTDEIRNTLGIDPNKIPTVQNLVRDLQKTIETTLDQDPTVNIETVTKAFLLENQRLYPFIRTQQDINRLAVSVVRNNKQISQLLASAKRLRRFRYAKNQSSQNVTLLSGIAENVFPLQLFAILNNWRSLSVPDLALSINAYFNTNKRRDLLFGLLFLDKNTLDALRDEYANLQVSAGDTNFMRRLAILKYINDIEQFFDKNPDLAKKLRVYWQKHLPKSAAGENFKPFVKNLLEVGAPNYYTNSYSRKVFGTQGPSYTGPSFGYFGNRFSITDLIFRKGRPHISSQIGIQARGVFKGFGGLKGLLGKAAMALKAIPGVGWLIGAVSAIPLLRKHWKVVGAAIAAGLYGLSQLFGSLVNLISFVGHVAAGAVIGFMIGGPPGAAIGAGIGFLVWKFGGIEGLLTAVGSTITGFLQGLAGAGAAVATGIGGILGGGILATTALLTTVGVLLGTLFLTITSLLGNVPPLPIFGGGTNISSCIFYRDGDATKELRIGNPQMASLITVVSNAVGVPPAIVAGIMRVETASALISTDPTYLSNDYDFHCSLPRGVDQIQTIENCTRYGIAFGVMQFTPGTFTGTFNNNRQEMGALFAKIDASTRIVPQDQQEPINLLRIYSIKDSIIASAFLVKNLKQSINGSGPWDKETVSKLASRYYSDGTCTKYPSCTDGPFDYGEDLWRSYSNCISTTIPPTGGLASCPVQDPYTIVNGTRDNPIPGRGGHCDPAYARLYPFWCPSVANAIDVAAKDGRSLLPVYLPTIEGKTVRWTFRKGNYTDTRVSGIGFGQDFDAVVDGHSYFLHLFHLDENSNLIRSQGYNSGELVANMYNMGGPHVHFTISKDGPEMQPHIPPPGGMGMCSNP